MSECYSSCWQKSLWSVQCRETQLHQQSRESSYYTTPTGSQSNLRSYWETMDMFSLIYSLASFCGGAIFVSTPFWVPGSPTPDYLLTEKKNNPESFAVRCLTNRLLVNWNHPPAIVAWSPLVVLETLCLNFSEASQGFHFLFWQCACV